MSVYQAYKTFPLTLFVILITNSKSVKTLHLQLMQTNKPHQPQQNAYTKIQDSKVEHACTGWFPMENSTLPKLSTLPLENSHTLETLSHKLAAILEFLIKTNQNQKIKYKYE